MKYELKKKIAGIALVADCKFVDGTLETTDPKKQKILDEVKHVKKIKEKKEVPTEVKENG